MVLGSISAALPSPVFVPPGEESLLRGGAWAHFRTAAGESAHLLPMCSGFDFWT